MYKTQVIIGVTDITTETAVKFKEKSIRITNVLIPQPTETGQKLR